jgi:2Fe-2S ferredoxin
MQIHVIDKAGERQDVETPARGRLMPALRNLPNGVQAICGGMMACATCHVHIAPSWFGRLPPPSKDELAMLDVLMHVTGTSRLSCQIELNGTLDGLELNLAPDE